MENWAILELQPSYGWICMAEEDASLLVQYLPAIIIVNTLIHQQHSIHQLKQTKRKYITTNL